MSYLLRAHHYGKGKWKCAKKQRKIKYFGGGGKLHLYTRYTEIFSRRTFVVCFWGLSDERKGIGTWDEDPKNWWWWAKDVFDSSSSLLKNTHTWSIYQLQLAGRKDVWWWSDQILIPFILNVFQVYSIPNTPLRTEITWHNNSNSLTTHLMAAVCQLTPWRSHVG